MLQNGAEKQADTINRPNSADSIRYSGQWLQKTTSAVCWSFVRAAADVAPAAHRISRDKTRKQ